MRRNALRMLLGASTMLVAGAAFPAGQRRVVDKRLLGTWRSDKERTVAMWKYAKDLDSDKRAHFEDIFGKLTVHFSQSHVSSELEDYNENYPYVVLGKDSSSVVIDYQGGKPTSLQHIHFEGDDYYYVLAGYNVEFFKRIST